MSEVHAWEFPVVWLPKSKVLVTVAAGRLYAQFANGKMNVSGKRAFPLLLKRCGDGCTNDASGQLPCFKLHGYPILPHSFFLSTLLFFSSRSLLLYTA